MPERVMAAPKYKAQGWTYKPDKVLVSRVQECEIMRMCEDVLTSLVSFQP